MAGRKTIELQFPAGGLNQRMAFQRQPPFTTPDCLNVRPVSYLTGRRTGGNRRGLGRFYTGTSTEPLGTSENRAFSFIQPCIYPSGQSYGHCLVMGCGGKLYTDKSVSPAEVSLGDLTLGTGQLMAADRLGHIFIANQTASGALDVDVTGTPTVTAWAAASGKGTVPTGCNLVALYRDRLMLAGGSTTSNQWYMSRQGDPYDWDYSQTDAGRAVSGSTSETGQIGEKITALIPHSVDYLLIGCDNSLWILKGDPAYGGSLSALSHTYGIISPTAYCYGASGEVYFLNKNGLYVVSGDGVPINLSVESIPTAFSSMDSGLYHYRLAYDQRENGVHIFSTKISSAVSTHYFFDIATKSFWPYALPVSCDPFALCDNFDRWVILGGRDGYVRTFKDQAWDFTPEIASPYQTAVSSRVVYGPIRLGGSAIQAGKLLEVVGELSSGSGSVSWSVKAGNVADGLLSVTAQAAGTWTPGLNYTARPRVRGGSFLLTLSASTAWGIENVTAILEQAGKLRLP